MAYHDRLMEHALDPIHTNLPDEMHLRRAVSAAYYAVFHLLIVESTQHWDNSALRTALGRGYDHGLMRTTSNRVIDSREFPYSNEEPKLVAKLKEIAQGFSQLQQDRHFADYNLTQPLDTGTALSQVKRAERIFRILPQIRHEQIVQEYLTLLVRNRVI